MRIAFVGLSSPTAYFYDHGRVFTKRSDWHWTPILESPQGLATLFDEIWFLHEALCPLTMRSQPFVKFLTENLEILPQIKPILTYSRNGVNESERRYVNSILNLSSQPNFGNYNEVIKTVFGLEPGPHAPIDNHSLGFKFDEINVHGDSMNMNNIVTDFLLAKKLSQITANKIELVTNRFTIPRIFQYPAIHREAQLAEGITISRIPVLQRPDGPEMIGIERIRNNVFLRDFRKKITDDAVNSEDMQHEVVRIEEEFERYRNTVLIKKQKDARLMSSIAKNAGSFTAGRLVPGISQVISFIKDIKTRKQNWTGFIASLES
jgi:hypothetical protein